MTTTSAAPVLKAHVPVSAGAGHRTPWRPFWALFVLGLLGILSLPLATVPELHRLRANPDFPPAPVWLLAVLSLIQPILLLAASTALGIRFAPRLGLVSYVHDHMRTGAPVWRRLRADFPVAVSAGALIAFIITLFDVFFALRLGESIRSAEPIQVTATVVGLLYGGITEEIMVRWGLVSVLAWGAWRIVQRGQGTPRASLMLVAITLTAILFGLGHLPGLSVNGPLSPLLVLRTMCLNALAGIVLGWIFWRRSLETAMVAHASTHLVLTALLMSLR